MLSMNLMVGRQSPARLLCIAKFRRARSDAPYRFKVSMHA